MAVTEISRDELKAFCKSAELESIIQKNYEKYQKRWLAWAEKKEKIKVENTQSWHWWAFLFGEFWLLYRKMYREALLIIILRILTIALAFIPHEAAQKISNFAPLVISLTVGFCGYAWYLKKCLALYNAQKKIEKEDEKETYLRQNGGTSFKFPLIYLAVFIVFISVPVLFIVGNSESYSENSYSSAYSDNIEFVRGGVFDFDSSVYLGNALENYPYFSSYTWSEYTTQQGRQFVRFTAYYDLIRDLETLGVLSEQINMEQMPVVEFNIDFAIDVDGTSYEIFGGTTMINGEVTSQYTKDVAFGSVQLFYQNKPVMVNGVTFGQIVNSRYSFIFE